MKSILQKYLIGTLNNYKTLLRKIKLNQFTIILSTNNVYIPASTLSVLKNGFCFKLIEIKSFNK
jgi:hypothetical protein